MNRYKLLMCLLVLNILLLVNDKVQAQKAANDIVGTWLVQKKDGQVEIYKVGDKYFGKITWMAEPNNKDGKPKTDTNNPTASKRSQAIVGLVMLKDLSWKGNGKWEDGTVYDPANGKTYSCSVKMKDMNTLEFTGFIGVSFIGRSENWTRVK